MDDKTPSGGMQFAEIAKQLGISPQRVHQIYQQAMFKLAHNPKVRNVAIEHGITVNEATIRQTHPFAAKRRKA